MAFQSLRKEFRPRLRQCSWNLSSDRRRECFRAVAVLWPAVRRCRPPKLFCLAGVRRRFAASSSHEARLKNISCCDGNSARRIRYYVHLVTSASAATLGSYMPMEKEWAAAFRISSGTTAACLFSRSSKTHLNSVLITMSSVAAFLSR